MGIEAIGKLHTIFPTKQVSERFSKREFVLELADQKFPQTVLFQLTGDRCSQLDGMQTGDGCASGSSLRGREWRSPQGELKYFNSLDVWKIEPVRAQQGRGNSTGNGYANGNGNGNGGRGRSSGSGSYAGPDDVPPPSDDMYGTPVRDDGDLPF